jgi:predicted Zn-dependent peptidase
VDNGLSHLVEHGLFRGCAAYPSIQTFNEAIEASSLGLGAATCREFVVFDATCRPSGLEALLGLVGAMLAAPTWTDLAIEQRIIVEELQDELDEAGRDIDVDNVAKLALMPGCGGGRKIGGDISRIKRFTVEDCQRWFQACYGASNLVLAVAGPLDHASVVAASERALGGLAAGEPVDMPPMNMRSDLPALEYVSHGGSQTSLQVEWSLPSPAAPEWPALVAAQRLLDDGTCARLRRRITDDAGLAYHVGSSLEVFADQALLVVEAEVSHDNVLAVLDAIFDTVADLAQLPPSESEWQRLRDRYAFYIDVSMDAAHEVSYRLGLDALRGHPSGVEHRRERFMALTPSDVTAVAEKLLGPDGAQITVVGALGPMERAGLRRRVHRLRTARTA